MALMNICMSLHSQQQSMQGLRQAVSYVYSATSSLINTDKTLAIARIRSCTIGQYDGAAVLRHGSSHWQQKNKLRRFSTSDLSSGSSDETAGPRTSVKCSSAIIREAQVVRVSNPAELLLEELEKKALAGSSSDSPTDAVDRLLRWDPLPKLEETQTFSVYEINDLDRDSPPFLPFSVLNVNSKQNKGKGFLGWFKNLRSTLSGAHVHGIGDLVPFSNKLYDGSLSLRLGITAGLTLVIRNYPGKGSAQDKTHPFFFPDRYETMYTFYLGDLGHISVQGPFITFEDTLLTVTGGAGLFREARGVCRLHNLSPLKLFYTFQLKGIPEIPRHLTAKVVPPSVDVKPIPEAANCEPGYVLPHYSD
ncbi:hypothetical protein CY35_01G022900 [Sphagnum magellanicum]|nr:hypothetical protein CY35_01G022900 [Sphagnum magellanicum]